MLSKLYVRSFTGQNLSNILLFALEEMSVGTQENHWHKSTHSANMTVLQSPKDV